MRPSCQRGAETFGDGQVGQAPFAKLFGVAPELQQRRRLAGKQGYIADVGWGGKTAAARLQKGFLTGPAAVEGGRPQRWRQREKLGLFMVGKKLPRDRLKRQIIPHLFQVNP